MLENYRTIYTDGEGEITEKKSRFIATVRLVEKEEDALAFIEEMKKKYWDATHNCSAFVIGDRQQIQRCSDDGEPQGTSGAPIVQMLVKEGITNVVVVVTRYFGGIKLGTGGLVRAYTGSAKLGLEAAEMCSVREVCRMKIEIEYTSLAKLQNMASAGLDEESASSGGFIIGDAEYSDKVTLDVSALPEDAEEVKRIFANVTSGSVRVIESEIRIEKV